MTTPHTHMEAVKAAKAEEASETMETMMVDTRKTVGTTGSPEDVKTTGEGLRQKETRPQGTRPVTPPRPQGGHGTAVCANS